MCCMICKVQNIQVFQMKLPLTMHVMLETPLENTEQFNASLKVFEHAVRTFCCPESQNIIFGASGEPSGGDWGSRDG